MERRLVATSDGDDSVADGERDGESGATPNHGRGDENDPVTSDDGDAGVPTTETPGFEYVDDCTL